MLRWKFPLNLRAEPSTDFEGYKKLNFYAETEIPIGKTHKGAFGYPRRFHTHEGVDLYCPEWTCVHAVEDGVVTFIDEKFTDHDKEPHWLTTAAIVVEGTSGAVVYGEVSPVVELGQSVKRGEFIAHAIPVFPDGTARPRCMLHLELRAHGTTDLSGWVPFRPPPDNLRDPTAFLLHADNEYNNESH